MGGGKSSERRRDDEAPKVLSGVKSGRGVSPPADYVVWGSVVSSPSGVRGGVPANNAFLAYFGVIEHFF